MEIILDNIAFSLQKAGGVTRVWAALIERMPEHHRVKYIEYPNSNIFRGNLELNSGFVEARSDRCIHIKKLFNIHLDNQNESFIFHSSIYRLCTNSKAINIITVHDFIDFKFGTYSLPSILKRYRMKRAIAGADILVAVSENTKRDLLYFFPHIDVKKVHVIANGKQEFTPRDNFLTYNSNTILYVGGRKGYKNFKLLVRTLLDMSQFRLVIVGGGTLDEDEISLLENLGVGRYTFMGRVDELAMEKLYQEAFCLVYPSLYEGFGLPVLEAQSAGCPVVAVNIGATAEILANSAPLMNTVDHIELRNKISELAIPSLRKKYIEDGLANSKIYNWDRMAKDYTSLYNNIIRNSNG